VQLEQLIDFASNHWQLVLALVVILGLLAYDFFVGKQGSVGPLEAVTLINRQDALVIDVRPGADFAKGHIVNARNIPLGELAKHGGFLEKQKERPIIFNCDSGARSNQACRQLRTKGFTEVYNLQGGILAWENANLPVNRRSR
jgi:rhodanese-related sulfurtransferase